MTEDQAWTIGRLLTWTTDYLRDHGAESPRLDAEVLLAHARGCPRIELYTSFEEQASDELRTEFRDLVRQRSSGAPVAYLVGSREFFSMSFDVTRDVLIPRPETEQLVVRSLDWLKSMQHSDAADGTELSVADVGTGSGIIAICLAKHCPTARVTAIDVSEAALDVARGNAQRHNLDDRITFVSSDLFAVMADDSQFDLIVSNPPYVSNEEMNNLSETVRAYEPALALSGGEKGTDIIERLVNQAPAQLRPDGWLLLEISPSIAGRVESLLDDVAKLSRRETLSDLAGLPRIAQAQRV